MSVKARKLASGRVVYDARVRNPTGGQYRRTFRTRREAETFHARHLADLSRGDWVDPRAGRVTLREYAAAWLEHRAALRPRTRELYEAQLKKHILPALGSTELAKLSTSDVRAWHARLLRAKRPGATTVAKCYRLLRSILTTAVEDGRIVKNPCVIKGAGVERIGERPVAAIAEVYALADAVPPKYRMMVLLATFGSLRFGELIALRRRSVDLANATLIVTEVVVERADHVQHFGPPKSDAGRRTVALPHPILEGLAEHLERFAQPGRNGLLFPDTNGDPLTRASWRRKWLRATRTVGTHQLRFHDLRHTGNTIAASTGASTKELMARMGHSSARAALIYQHATRQRDAAIADAIGAMIEKSTDCR